MEDQQFFREIFQKLNMENQLLFFQQRKEFLDYLEKTTENPSSFSATCTSPGSAVLRCEIRW